MPTASGKGVGNALVRVVNKHAKKSMRNSLRNMLNKARKNGSLTSSFVNNNVSTISTPVSNEMSENNGSISPCTITPGGQRMRKEKGKWVKCTGGGARKTRRGKKSRRMTRRKR